MTDLGIKYVIARDFDTRRNDTAWTPSEKGAETARVFFKTALKVANADEMPRWAPGNEFEQEWKKLHRLGE